MRISTSFLACKDIKTCVSNLDKTDADYIHVDFIKGKFVTGKKIPFRKLKRLPDYTTKRLDVHLMTEKLDKYIPKFSMLNCEFITFHIEATKNPMKYIKMIHSYGIKCGLAINPDTSINEIEPYLGNVDLILVMGVEPGYGGQEFIPDVIEKIKEIRKRILFHKLDVLISVDGGINDKTILEINNYIDIAVAGSFITNSNNYQDAILLLK